MTMVNDGSDMSPMEIVLRLSILGRYSMDILRLDNRFFL
jgi:hypothetical protein